MRGAREAPSGAYRLRNLFQAGGFASISLMEEAMLRALRSLLAEIAPAWVRNEAQEQVSHDRSVLRDTLSSKRNPVPFGRKGVRPVPDRREEETPRSKGAAARQRRR